MFPIVFSMADFLIDYKFIKYNLIYRKFNISCLEYLIFVHYIRIQRISIMKKHSVHCYSYESRKIRVCLRENFINTSSLIAENPHKNRIPKTDNYQFVNGIQASKFENKYNTEKKNVFIYNSLHNQRLTT